MIPRKMKIAAMTMLASAGLVAGLASPAAATASTPTLGPAGTVGNPVHTANYQMFGTAQCYTGAAARPVRNLHLDGLLSGTWKAESHTDTNGVWRFNGNITWAGDITTGGNVTVRAPGITGQPDLVIGLAEFESHRVGGFFGTSAGPFRIQLSDTYCDTLTRDAA